MYVVIGNEWCGLLPRMCKYHHAETAEPTDPGVTRQGTKHVPAPPGPATSTFSFYRIIAFFLKNWFFLSYHWPPKFSDLPSSLNAVIGIGILLDHHCIALLTKSSCFCSNGLFISAKSQLIHNHHTALLYGIYKMVVFVNLIHNQVIQSE